MTTTYEHTVVVGPGGVIEVHDPSLPEGRMVDVTVTVEEPETTPGSLTRFLGAAPGLFVTPDEADAFISAERDAWDRQIRTQGR